MISIRNLDELKECENESTECCDGGEDIDSVVPGVREHRNASNATPNAKLEHYTAREYGEDQWICRIGPRRGVNFRGSLKRAIANTDSSRRKNQSDGQPAR